jgi:hypothetical protein
MKEQVAVGFQAFVNDGDTTFGAVRRVNEKNVVVYVENAGDFIVPREAIDSVHSEKVVFRCAKLDSTLRRAIGHAHDAEVPGL